MNIVKLRTNHIVNPIGYSFEQICFSWIVQDAVGDFTAYTQVQVSKSELMTDTVYDSGKVEGSSSLEHIADFPIEECTRYYWSVTIWDNSGTSEQSKVAYFETAKDKIEGHFIKAPFEEHPVFIREIEVDKKIQSARMYITALGIYEIAINGVRVGDEYFTPYYNDYELWLQHQTYDITKYFVEGKNEIQVMLGNGWYKGRFGFIGELDCLYGDELKFACDMYIQYESGKVSVIRTDDEWTCVKSPVVASNIYDGEVYDSRIQVSNIETISCVKVDDNEQKELSDKTIARKSVPVNIQECIKPIEIIITPLGETVLDFGQNMTGWVEFLCEEEEGQEIFLQFGEILQGGNFYNNNLRSAKQEYTYISNGKKAKVRPYFTFYGFRYVKVQGITKVDIGNFMGCVLYSVMEQTGEITTSNQKVNRLFLNALWGQKGNFLDVPTDCPQRDERMGWTGDAQAFCSTASYNMYTPAFYTKYMYDMKLEQKNLGGSVPHVVPDCLTQIKRQLTEEVNNFAINSIHGSCAWADAATIIPWKMYQFYGDKSLLEDQYDNMKMWTDYIKMIDDTECNGSRLWTHGFHFADWLALDNYQVGSSLGGTDCYYVASAFYLYSTELTAKAAQALGKTEEYAYYTGLAEEIRSAMQEEYFTSTGRIAVDTQTGLVLALYFNIAKKEDRKRLIEDLRSKLEKEKVHLTTGFVGTGYLCPVLSEIGLGDYAYTLLLNEDYPSWLYEVNMGATTIWERWNSVLPDGTMNSRGMNSLNHYAYGAIVEWMYRYMSGLDMVEPGFKSFVIKPEIDARFEWNKMKYESSYGIIRSEWKIEQDVVTYEVEVPFDTKATFVLRQNGETVTINGEESTELLANKQVELTKGVYIIKVFN